jgi:hypothetical protein
MQQVPPPPPPGGSSKKYGATVDQDGKSNVWGIEPAMKVQPASEGLSNYSTVIGIGALLFLSIPFLPLLFAANPDQA